MSKGCSRLAKTLSQLWPPVAPIRMCLRDSTLRSEVTLLTTCPGHLRSATSSNGGSGDDDPTDGKINTVDTLYPLAHAYWGLIDNVSGQNLVDYGIKATVNPLEKVTLAGVFHWFDRATSNDAVYNITGTPFAAANGNTEIGNEFDLVATITPVETLSVQAGYLWFWYGNAISGSPQARPDASQFYVQTTLTF